jgi:uncharacterized peroxidase-related enzyme
MRLAILEHGHRRRARVALRLMRTIARSEPDDVVKTSLYHPEVFGRAWIAALREIMRGPSEWTKGERELFAAFASRANRCPYCVGVHTGTSTLALARSVTVERLDAWRDGSFGPRITPVFALLERVAFEPAAVGPSDIEAVRSAGVSDAAIEDALGVSFLFNVVNRLANAFDYAYDSEAERLTAARMLLRLDYRLPGPLLR